MGYNLTAALLLILLLLGVVSAAGAATGNPGAGAANATEKKNQRTNISVSQDDNRTDRQLRYKGQECSAQANLTTRIACRLEQRGIENLNITEESCKGVANPQSCQSLYARVYACYDSAGRQKDQCFKRVAGFIKPQISKQALAEKNNRSESLRYYAVFLLYDLQQKVEEAYTNNLTTQEQASEIIALIVEAKQSILLNKPKSEIKQKIQELKEKLKEIRI